MRKTAVLVIMVVVALFVGAVPVLRATESGDSNQADAKEQSALPVAQAADRQEESFRAKEFALGLVSNPIVVQQSCGSDSRYISVTFKWGPSGKGEQWADISLLANDFAAGTFIGAGPFTQSTGQITWDGLMSGRAHYFRVNTLTATGWESSKTMVFTTGTCVNGAVMDVYDPGLQVLGQRFLDAISSYGEPGTYDACVTDLQTGQSACAVGVVPMLSGCVINTFVLAQSTLDLQNFVRPESDVGDLMSRTTWSSNASTAHELYGVVGNGNVWAGVNLVRGLIARLGLNSTILDHSPAFDESVGVNESNWITALDAVNALAKFYRLEVLALPWRDYLFGKMGVVKPGLNYLVGHTPGGIISHKNGFYWAEGGYVDNDIGIVRFGPNGENAYAIAFLSEGVPQEYADIVLGQQIVELAWDYFSAKYQ